MKKCKVPINALKTIIEEWWTGWNLSNPTFDLDDIPEEIQTILVSIETETDYRFNLMEGRWFKEELLKR